MVSSLVGSVFALAKHHQFVMDAMFAHEFTDTDIEKQQSLSTVVLSTSSFSNFIPDVLGQRCMELSMLKQLPSRPSHPWRISPAWSTSVRVREQVFRFLNRLDALGNCAATSTSLALLVSTRRLSIRTPAQVDKGGLGDL